MSTEVARKPPGLSELLEGNKEQIARALPRHLTPERMIRVALTAYKTTPALQKCDPISIASAIMEAAQLGLEPDGVLGHAYLVPYGSRCQLIPGYKGLCELAYRSGKVTKIAAEVVRENDWFEYEYGLDERLKHIPADQDRGAVTHVYAYYKMTGGGSAFNVLSVQDVEDVRKSSRAANNGPWVTHWDEMAKKTCIRRLLKLAPLSVEVARAVAIDEYAEAGMPPVNHFARDPEPIRAPIALTDFTPSDEPNRGHEGATPSDAELDSMFAEESA